MICFTEKCFTEAAPEVVELDDGPTLSTLLYNPNPAHWGITPPTCPADEVGRVYADYVRELILLALLDNLEWFIAFEHIRPTEGTPRGLLAIKPGTADPAQAVEAGKKILSWIQGHIDHENGKRPDSPGKFGDDESVHAKIKRLPVDGLILFVELMEQTPKF